MIECRSPGALHHGFPLSRELWLTRHWAVNEQMGPEPTSAKNCDFFPLQWNGLGLRLLWSSSCPDLWQTQLDGCSSILTSQESASVWQSINLSPFQPCNTIHPLLILHTLYKWFPVWFLFSKAFAKVGKHLPFITRKLVLYCSLLWSLRGHDPFEILSSDFFFTGKKTHSPHLALEQNNCTPRFPLNGWVFLVSGVVLTPQDLVLS